MVYVPLPASTVSRETPMAGIEIPKGPVFVFLGSGDRRSEVARYAEEIEAKFGEGSALIEARYLSEKADTTLVMIEAWSTEWRELLIRRSGWRQLQRKK